MFQFIPEQFFRNYLQTKATKIIVDWTNYFPITSIDRGCTLREISRKKKIKRTGQFTILYG